MKLDDFLTPYIKINSKPETIKILEESTGSNFSDISHSTVSPDTSPKAKETKAKINYWNYNKIQTLCTANNQQN